MLAAMVAKRIEKATKEAAGTREVTAKALLAGGDFDDSLIEPMARAEATCTLWHAVNLDIDDLTGKGMNPEVATQQALAMAHKRTVDQLAETGVTRTTSLIRRGIAEERHDATLLFLRNVKSLLQL